MRFVTPKSQEQLDMQTLHRARDRMVRERTSLMNHVWMAPEKQGLSSNLLNVDGRIACAHVSGLLCGRYDRWP
jgi:hypothetical protein